MISWIQRNFQQHFKWLFLALLIVVIISFVFITNASSGLGHGGLGRKQPPRPFLGLDLSQAEDVRRLMQDAQLSIALRFAPGREIPETQIMAYAQQRHATLWLADQLGLPAPTQEQVVAHIRTLRAFAGQDGQFDAKRYAEFTDSFRTNPRANPGDVSRVLAEDARASAYEKLLAGPGYVLPSDVAEQLARRGTTWTLAVANLDASAFAPRIDSADTVVRPWFEQNARRFDIPAKVGVSALRVPAARFADTVKLTEAEVRAAYDANPARYPAPAGAAKPEIKIDPATGKDANADANFAAVRALVEADLRKQRAEQAALAAVDDLAVRLLEQSVTPAGLAAFAQKHPGVTLEDLGAISAAEIPATLGGNAAGARVAPELARLSAERPYSNPLPVPDGAALLVWRESIPARTPAFEEVRERVVAEYQTAEKRRLFDEAARKLRESVATAVAAGKPFADAITAAATAAGFQAKVTTPPPFNLSERFPEGLDFQALQALESLSKGKVSEFIPSDDKSGILVYAVDQKLPAVDPASPQYISTRTQLAETLGRATSGSVLHAFVEAELSKAQPVLD